MVSRAEGLMHNRIFQDLFTDNHAKQKPNPPKIQIIFNSAEMQEMVGKKSPSIVNRLKKSIKKLENGTGEFKTLCKPDGEKVYQLTDGHRRLLMTKLDGLRGYKVFWVGTKAKAEKKTSRYTKIL